MGLQVLTAAPSVSSVFSSLWCTRLVTTPASTRPSRCQEKKQKKASNLSNVCKNAVIFFKLFFLNQLTLRQLTWIDSKGCAGSHNTIIKSPAGKLTSSIFRVRHVPLTCILKRFFTPNSSPFWSSSPCTASK